LFTGIAGLPFSVEAMDSPMTCPQCGAADLIEIKHRLPEGTEVQFFACHRCEEKWWDRDGVQIDLAHVLDLVRRSRR